jgi:hypothetical protein
MKCTWYSLALIAILVQSAQPACASRPEESLIRRSTYIFEGQVEKAHASNLKILPATESTALVRVERVLLAPSSMSNFTGQLITVELATPDSLRPGERVAFFTNAWLYGESLAVKEVGHTSTNSKDASARTIEQARAGIEEEKVQARIQLATAVIVGRVAITRPLKKEGKVGPVSEHDPDWQIAEIEVESVLKGTPTKSKVAVLYPKSMDVMWFATPRFQQGQEGTWFLQQLRAGEGEEDMTRELGGSAYVALDPLDFRPKSENARIRRLVSKVAKSK